eukprot:jgi/Chlat1/4329/Chrsp29S00346
MNRTTKFRKVRNAYAAKLGVVPASLAFTFAGALNGDEDTAEVLRVRTDDVILAAVNFAPRFATMLDSHDLCDVELVCGPERNRLKAHKAVLAARSGKFAGMFRSTSMREGKAAAIELLNVDKATMECILDYIYTDSCDVPKDFDSCVTLLAAAEEYLLPLLKRDCELELVAMDDLSACC